MLRLTAVSNLFRAGFEIASDLGISARRWPRGAPLSEACGPPQFQEKRSRSDKAILGALREFRGILGAALGIGNSILGIRNSILRMASHDLINTKPTILGATLGAIPGIAANPPERFSFAPAFSERFFKNWGGPRAPDSKTLESRLRQSDNQKNVKFLIFWRV